MQPAPPPARNTLGVGCAIAFAAPFFIGGLLALITAAFLWWRGRPLREMLVLLLFGACFTGISAMFATLMIKSTNTQAQRDALRAREPERPWLWRKEWVEGVMLDQSGATGWFFLFFTVFWNLVTMPMFYLVWRDRTKEQWMLLIVGLFPLIGVFLVFGAVYQLLRRQRYGLSRCTIDRIPILPGRSFSGTIEAKIAEAPASGFAMKLSCARRVVTGSGKNRSTSEHLLWQEEQTVSGARAMPSPNGIRVPFTFTVPHDAEPSDERESDNALLWRLEVRAEVPGVDYAATFELPVFRTGRSDDMFAPAPHVGDAHDAALAIATPSEKSRIAISRLPNGGEEYRIALRAGFFEIFFFMLFAIGWWAATVFMIWKGAPICFPIVFVLCGLLLVAAGIDMYLGRSHVKAERAGLTVRRSWLGVGKSVFHPREDVEALEAAISSTSGRTVNYSITAKLRHGKKAGVARYVRNKRDAEIVAARVGRALGL